MGNLYNLIIIGFVMFSIACSGLLYISASDNGFPPEEYTGESERIKPFKENPAYWQYNEKPLLLIGGTDQDNLFNHPDLPPDGVEAHLDLLVTAGGNYIRNTMSSRDEGNAWPFMQLENGKYDLEQWNPEYWERFENLLKLTELRDIIVQIEIWDPWDIYGDIWTMNPWNPQNNINYTTDTSSLEIRYDPPGYADGTSHGKPHDFLLTVPEAGNDQFLLYYQSRFVEKLLSYSLSYGHVLYCITNEIHPQYPQEWGWYWSQFIKKTASEYNRSVFVTEMFWQPDMKHPQHKASMEHPEMYDYFEASQNSAVLDPETHWENLMYIRKQLAPNPRPVNHAKNYGVDTGYAWTGTTQNVIEKFWRNVFAGTSSSRFHRPPAGIGLDKTAQKNLRSMRMITDSLNIFHSIPLNEKLSERNTNEAYAFGKPGEAYAVYFPGSGSVELDLEPGDYRVTWLDINSGIWQDSEMITDISGIRLESPAAENQVVLIKAVNQN